jgi:ferredoxin
MTQSFAEPQSGRPGRSTAPAIPDYDEPTKRPPRTGGAISTAVTATISVDNNRCHLYAICQDEAPDVFDVASDGRLHYRGRIGADLLPEALQAVRFCPMQAVRLDIG